MDDGDTEPKLVQVNPVSLAADLLAAYDTQMRAAEVSGLPAGVYAETDPPITGVFAAEAGGRILSAAWLMLKPGTESGGLWGGSTLSHR